MYEWEYNPFGTLNYWYKSGGMSVIGMCAFRRVSSEKFHFHRGDKVWWTPPNQKYHGGGINSPETLSHGYYQLLHIRGNDQLCGNGVAQGYIQLVYVWVGPAG